EGSSGCPDDASRSGFFGSGGGAVVFGSQGCASRESSEKRSIPTPKVMPRVHRSNAFHRLSDFSAAAISASVRGTEWRFIRSVLIADAQNSAQPNVNIVPATVAIGAGQECSV